MSLINDALKKAARQRAEEQADMTPIMPGGGGSRGRRGRLGGDGAAEQSGDRGEQDQAPS